MPGGKWSLPVSGEVNGGANPQFGINLNVNAEGDELNLQGLVTKDGIGTLSLKTASVNLEKYAVAAKYLENVQDSAGLVQDLHLRWNNDGKRVQIDGDGKLNAVRGKMAMNGKWYNFQIDGAISVADNVIELKPLSLNVDGQKLDVEGKADLANLKNLEEVTAKGKITYGKGTIVFNGGYDENVKAFLADASIKNIKMLIPNMPEDSININGDIALLADVKDDHVKLQVAADAFDFLYCFSVRVSK